jgi:hypothetical protein
MPPVEIPKSVTVPIRASEPVADYCKRGFVELARAVGLPLQEQVLFADSLIYAYPDKNSVVWFNDPTPRDNDASVKPDDFNYFLLRQYLNEHRGAGKRKLSVAQVKAVEGKVFSTFSIDAVTEAELKKWLQDFVYRGGELNTGREAPISRKGLVPALQALASKADITWVPQIMRSKNWNEGATLMEEWFRRPVAIRPARIEDTPINFGPPLLNAIKMSWVLGFARAKTVYDKMFSDKIWQNDAGKREISKVLDSLGITAQMKASPGKSIEFGDLASANVITIEATYLQSRSCENGTIQDGLAAALANFNFRLAIKGSASFAGGKTQVSVKAVGVYVKDSYDFINDGSFNWLCLCRDQPLGSWDKGVGSVSNDTFNNWRTANGKGGDFLIYSDVKITEMKPAVTFTL